MFAAKRFSGKSRNENHATAILTGRRRTFVRGTLHKADCCNAQRELQYTILVVLFTKAYTIEPTCIKILLDETYEKFCWKCQSFGWKNSLIAVAVHNRAPTITVLPISGKKTVNLCSDSGSYLTYSYSITLIGSFHHGISLIFICSFDLYETVGGVSDSRGQHFITEHSINNRAFTITRPANKTSVTQSNFAPVGKCNTFQKKPPSYDPGRQFPKYLLFYYIASPHAPPLPDPPG